MSRTVCPDCCPEYQNGQNRVVSQKSLTNLVSFAVLLKKKWDPGLKSVSDVNVGMTRIIEDRNVKNVHIRRPGAWCLTDLQRCCSVDHVEELSRMFNTLGQAGLIVHLSHFPHIPSYQRDTLFGTTLRRVVTPMGPAGRLSPFYTFRTFKKRLKSQDWPD